MFGERRTSIQERIYSKMSNTVERYNAAEKLKDQGKSAEAIAALEALLQDDPNHILSHLTLGRLYTLASQFDKAVEHGRRACELEPNEPFNFTALSLTYQRTFAGTNDTKYITLAEDARDEARRLESLK
jgi:tetratricopeptide (TPR) repeat protein